MTGCLLVRCISGNCDPALESILYEVANVTIRRSMGRSKRGISGELEIMKN